MRCLAFQLVCGAWSTPFEELVVATKSSRSTLLAIVRAAQLTPGDTERITSPLQAVIHGAVDLTLNGHLAIGGKGNADPAGLLRHLHASTAIARSA